MGETVRFMTEQGESGGEITLPGGSAPAPAVIILPAIAGLNSYINDVAKELAESGFVAFALDY
jgi:dienelactone hydrolase